MPYISKELRAHLETGAVPNSPGELNYVFTMCINLYLDKHGLSYTKLNEVMGVLACVQQEVYRRLAVPYEDAKIVENGEVFWDFSAKVVDK